MWSHRRILAVLATALLATILTYLAVRDPGQDADAVETSGESITTTTRPTTTTAARPTTTSSSTTVATSETTVATTAAPAAGTARRSSPAPTPAPTDPPPPPPPGCPGLPPVDSPSGGFTASVRCVTAADLGSSWRRGCPVGPDKLVAIDASHWGYDGAVHTGRVIVAASRADGLVVVFQQLFDAGFQIERMEPVDRYGSDDHASMVANNTSAFNCRTVSGSTRWSEHAYGQAIDVNPLVNPYVRGETVDPPEGEPYKDRSRNDPGMIHDGDAAVAAFAAQGWKWGGYWSSGQDYQHFSTSGR